MSEKTKIQSVDLNDLSEYERVQITLELFRTQYPLIYQMLMIKKYKTLDELKMELLKIDKARIVKSLGMYKDIVDKVANEDNLCNLTTAQGVFNYFKRAGWVKAMSMERLNMLSNKHNVSNLFKKGKK
ncbi:MAG: hypothetical protein ACRC92_21585 [Peptostreptococcaceae bacterium]